MSSERIYQAATESAAIIEASWLGTIAIQGPDSVTWLNSLVTCDVRAVRPGTVAYGLALLKNGRIISDLWVAAGKDRLLLGVARERLSQLRDHIERYLIMEDATHEDVSAEHAWILAFGPRAPEIVSARAQLLGESGGRTGLTTVGDAALVVTTANRERALASCAEEPGAVIGSAPDYGPLMLELLVPRFGVDFGEKNYPQEAWLEKTAVSFSKGCYLGQEVVCRLEMRGHVSKQLVPIQLDGEAAPVPAVGTEVRNVSDGAALGVVSSAGLSRRLGTPLVLAMIKGESPSPGARVRVGDAAATVIDPRQVQIGSAS